LEGSRAGAPKQNGPRPGSHPDGGRSITALSLPAFATETAAATAAAGAFRFGTRFVDVQRATGQIDAVNGGDRFLAFAIVCHFDESKTAGLPRVAIRDDVYPTNCAVSFKQRTDRIFLRPKTEVSNVNVFQVNFSFSDLKAANLEGRRR